MLHRHIIATLLPHTATCYIHPQIQTLDPGLLKKKKSHTFLFPNKILKLSECQKLSATSDIEFWDYFDQCNAHWLICTL